MNKYIESRVNKVLDSLNHCEALNEIKARNFAGLDGGVLYVSYDTFKSYLPYEINTFVKSGEWLDHKGFANADGSYELQSYDYDVFKFQDFSLKITPEMTVLDIDIKLDYYLIYLKESLSESINELDKQLLNY